MNNKNRNILIPVLVLVFAGLIIYFIWAQAQDDNTVTPSTNQITPAPEQDDETVTPTPIEQNWQIHRSASHRFRIQYPQEMEVGQTARGGVEFMLVGPTQEEDTDLFDGIRLVLISGTHDQEFSQFVEQQHQSLSQEPPVEDITELTSINLADRQGYEFVVTGPFGDNRHIILPIEEGRFLQIIETVFDPTNQGFEQMTQQMLTTLEIINNN